MADAPEAQIAVIRDKLESGAMSPDQAVQKLVALMREHSDLPGAKELYQEASKRAFDVRRSSMAYSHPPPPTGPEDKGE